MSPEVDGKLAQVAESWNEIIGERVWWRSSV